MELELRLLQTTEGDVCRLLQLNEVHFLYPTPQKPSGESRERVLSREYATTKERIPGLSPPRWRPGSPVRARLVSGVAFWHGLPRLLRGVCAVSVPRRGPPTALAVRPPL